MWDHVQDPERNGAWAGLQDWPLIGIHAVSLPDGRILSFGTDETGMQSGQFIYDIWDPLTGIHTTLPNVTGTDVFCSAAVFDPYLDLVLMLGGDNRPNMRVNEGIADVTAYDPRTETIFAAPNGDLVLPRWYPGALTLASGDVLAIGGKGERATPDGPQGGNTRLEIGRSGVAWDLLEGTHSAHFGVSSAWWYPHLFQASDGRVLTLDAQAGGGGGSQYWVIDLAGEGAMISLGRSDHFTRNDLPSVNHRADRLLFMANDGKIVEADFSTSQVVETVVADLGAALGDASMTILADGRVAITGGSVAYRDVETAHRGVMIYDPEDGSFIQIADETETLARLYHSSAMLTVDGTLLSLGGGAPGPLTNLNAEIWAPDYLFDVNGTPAERITIAPTQETILPGQSLILEVSDASEVTRITGVKGGTSTHARSYDAQFAELTFTKLTDTLIEVHTPENGHLLRPGPWMLFAFDQAGTPSQAAMIDVDVGRLLPEGTPGRYAFGTSTYELGTPGLTWLQAQAEAEARGGTLVQIDSAAENAFVTQTFVVDAPVYIGARDRNFDGVFETADGTPLSYTNWMPNRPEGGSQTFARIANAEGQWDDGKSSTNLFFEGATQSFATPLSVIEFENTRTLVAQTGEAEVFTTRWNDWDRVIFDTPMVDPVVVVSPPSLNGVQQGNIRVRNVTETGFEVQFDEWEYLDDWHVAEAVSWMAVERGVHVLSDGAVIEAGIAPVENFARVDLSADFGPTGAVVLSQIGSHHGVQSAVERVSDVNDTGFVLRIQEEEALNDGHVSEDVHWIALEQGNHNDFSAFLDRRAIDHRDTVLDLARASADGVLMAELQSFFGSDTATLRISAQDAATATLRLEEEQSADLELWHTPEDLAWATIDPLIYL